MKILIICLAAFAMINCATIDKATAFKLKSEKVQARAAFDLGCDKEKIAITEIDNSTMGAKCSTSNKQGTYVFENHWCNVEGTDPGYIQSFEKGCKILLNNKSGK